MGLPQDNWNGRPILLKSFGEFGSRSIPSIISRFSVVIKCVTTGATAFTCGTVRSLSATLIETGAPVMPVKKLEPGGETITSNPIPFCRSALSLSMLKHRPTMSRISVTSIEIAKTLIKVRSGPVHQVGKNHFVHSLRITNPHR